MIFKFPKLLIVNVIVMSLLGHVCPARQDKAIYTRVGDPHCNIATPNYASDGNLCFFGCMKAVIVRIVTALIRISTPIFHIISGVAYRVRTMSYRSLTFTPFSTGELILKLRGIVNKVIEEAQMAVDKTCSVLSRKIEAGISGMERQAEKAHSILEADAVRVERTMHYPTQRAQVCAERYRSEVEWIGSGVSRRKTKQCLAMTRESIRDVWKPVKTAVAELQRITDKAPVLVRGCIDNHDHQPSATIRCVLKGTNDLHLEAMTATTKLKLASEKADAMLKGTIAVGDKCIKELIRDGELRLADVLLIVKDCARYSNVRTK